MHAKHLNTVNFAQAIRQIRAAAAAGNCPLLVGDPGIGKSSITKPIAKSLNLTHVPLIGTTLDSVDVGGALVVDQTGDEATVRRVVMAALRRACAEPCLLVIEEVTCLPQDVQAALLDVLWSRHVGDGVPLHPGTVIVALTNPIEQAPNASEPAASLIGRFSPILYVRPTVGEVVDYFSAVLGADDSADVAASWFRDWAATASAVTDLIQFAPPDISLNEGAPWAAPRAWEYGLRQAANVEALGLADGLDADEVKEDVFLALCGSVGKDKAQNYLAVRDLRDLYDSPADVVKDPHNAKCPDDVKTQIGALGLLQEVARLDAYAAWIFAARLRPEIGQAAGQALTPRQVPRKSKWLKDGEQARVKLMSQVGRRRRQRVA